MAEELNQEAMVADLNFNGAAPEDPAPAEGTEGAAAATEITLEAGKENEGAEAGATDAGKPKTPEKGKAEPTEFEKMFMDEKGEPDLKRFLAHQEAAQKVDQGPARAVPIPGQQFKPDPTQQPVKTLQEQQIEEFRTYRTNLSKNLSVGLDYVAQAIQAGYTPQQAIDYAKGKLGTEIQDHLTDWQFQKQREFDEKRMREHQEQIDAANTRPMSESNHNLVAAEYGLNRKQLDSLLFSPEYGLKHIGRMFDLAHPGLIEKGGEEAQKALNNFYVKFTGKRENIRYLVELARADVSRKLQPQLMARFRAAGAEQEKNGKLASVRPSNKQPTPNRKTPGGLDDYLHGPDKRFKNVDEIG